MEYTKEVADALAELSRHMDNWVRAEFTPDDLAWNVRCYAKEAAEAVKGHKS